MTTLTIFSLKGQKTGTFKADCGFDGEPNVRLLSQAVHVWRSNQRRGLAKAMTRGESNRTTAKWYRQKHTGRARHGSKSAPIFVGGGVAHGPTGLQNYHRRMSRKMTREALVSALAAKASQGKMLIVSNLEKIEPKVKTAKALLGKLGLAEKKVLICPEKGGESLARATGNLGGVTVMPAGNLNAYQVLNSEAIIFTPESAEQRLKRAARRGRRDSVAERSSPDDRQEGRPKRSLKKTSSMRKVVGERKK